MVLDDLREMYANLREESMSGLLDDEDWEWMQDAWNEATTGRPKCATRRGLKRVQ